MVHKQQPTCATFYMLGHIFRAVLCGPCHVGLCCVGLCCVRPCYVGLCYMGQCYVRPLYVGLCHLGLCCAGLPCVGLMCGLAIFLNFLTHWGTLYPFFCHGLGGKWRAQWGGGGGGGDFTDPPIQKPTDPQMSHPHRP